MKNLPQQILSRTSEWMKLHPRVGHPYKILEYLGNDKFSEEKVIDHRIDEVSHLFEDHIANYSVYSRRLNQQVENLMHLSLVDYYKEPDPIEYFNAYSSFDERREVTIRLEFLIENSRFFLHQTTEASGENIPSPLIYAIETLPEFIHSLAISQEPHKTGIRYLNERYEIWTVNDDLLPDLLTVDHLEDIVTSLVSARIVNIATSTIHDYEDLTN